MLETALTTTDEQAPSLAADFLQVVSSIKSTIRTVDAGTMRAAAEADDPPAELKALAVAVREGRTSWEQLAAGEATELPEVQAVQRAVDEQARRLGAAG